MTKVLQVGEGQRPQEEQEQLRELQERLTGHLRAVVQERDPISAPGGHASVKTYLAREFGRYGEVARHSFFYHHHTHENLVLDLPGQSREGFILIGAHYYDAVPGSPGADDNQIGRTRFGNAWTGKEGSLSNPSDNAFRKYVATVEARTRVEVLPDDWPAMKKEQEKLLPQIERRDEIQELIARECEAGHLITAWRADGGGPLQTIPTEHWGLDSLLYRFFYCRMSPTAPFANEINPSGGGYIFVEYGSLFQLLQPRPSRSPQGAKDKYDWVAIKRFVFETLDEHGPPDPHDPDLPNDQALVTKVLEYCNREHREEPARSTATKRVSAWVKEYRERTSRK
jgi:hypothetical protein